MSTATDRMTDRILLHRGEPPVDLNALQQAQDIQFYLLRMLTTYAHAVREMLFVSGLFNEDEQVTVEKATGAINGLLESKYEAVMNCLVEQEALEDSFFDRAQPRSKPEPEPDELGVPRPREKELTPRVLKRRVYFSTSRQRQKAKAPQPAPSTWTVSEYKSKTKRLKFKQRTFEK